MKRALRIPSMVYIIEFYDSEKILGAISHNGCEDCEEFF